MGKHPHNLKRSMSFNVTSLFTNLPLEYTIGVMKLLFQKKSNSRQVEGDPKAFSLALLLSLVFTPLTLDPTLKC